MTNPLASLPAAFARLAPRERLLLQLACAVTLATIGFFLVRGLVGARADLERRIVSKERQREEVERLAVEHRALARVAESSAASTAAQPKDFSLFTFLEGAGTKTVTREKITAMNPTTKAIDETLTQESVEMRIAGVGLAPTIDLLHQIQSSPVPLEVATLRMRKRFNDPYAFDLTVVVSMLRRSRS